MVWTLLTLLTIAWVLVLMAGIGGPSSWVLPAAIGGLLLYRIATGMRRE